MEKKAKQVWTFKTIFHQLNYIIALSWRFDKASVHKLLLQPRAVLQPQGWEPKPSLCHITCPLTYIWKGQALSQPRRLSNSLTECRQGGWPQASSEGAALNLDVTESSMLLCFPASVSWPVFLHSRTYTVWFILGIKDCTIRLSGSVCFS